MPPMVWSILMVIVMIALIVIELFTPSFGILTILSVVALLGSIYFAMQDSWTMGFAMIGVNLAIVPIVVFLSMQLIRRSPMALNERIRRTRFEAEPEAKQHEWVGLEGEALTPLCPGGKAQFGDLRLDVLTRGKYVEAGTRVRVVGVEFATALVEIVQNESSTETPQASTW